MPQIQGPFLSRLPGFGQGGAFLGEIAERRRLMQDKRNMERATAGYYGQEAPDNRGLLDKWGNKPMQQMNQQEATGYLAAKNPQFLQQERAYELDQAKYQQDAVKQYRDALKDAVDDPGFGALAASSDVTPEDLDNFLAQRVPGDQPTFANNPQNFDVTRRAAKEQFARNATTKNIPDPIEIARELRRLREAGDEQGVNDILRSLPGQGARNEAILDLSLQATERMADGAKYASLAAEFNEAKKRGEFNNNTGALAYINEGVRSIFGQENDLTTLRRRYRGVINSEAVRNLPPGPATDRDIELALAAFNSPNANPDQIVAGLEALARLSRVQSKYMQFKAEYLETPGTRVSGLGAAFRKEMLTSEDPDIAEYFEGERVRARVRARQDGGGLSALEKEAQKL